MKLDTRIRDAVPIAHSGHYQVEEQFYMHGHLLLRALGIRRAINVFSSIY